MGVETSAAWQALQLHCDSGMGAMHLSSLFGEANRVDRFSLELDELYIDFSKNRITEETLSLLQALAEQQGLKHEIERLLVGEEVNDTEERPALHSALRAQGQDVSGVAEQVQGDVEAVLQKMTQMVDKIRAGHWRGYSGKPITDVVNIGVGGPIWDR